eukprot:scaffold1525_cov142-Cylindrotheca_fusiformis.AAC.190
MEDRRQAMCKVASRRQLGKVCELGNKWTMIIVGKKYNNGGAMANTLSESVLEMVNTGQT